MARYDPLVKLFGDSVRTEGTAILSFTQIEGLMGKALPVRVQAQAQGDSE